MADVYIVDVDTVPVYTIYFDITLIPATIFFFNGQHIKVDWRFVLWNSYKMFSYPNLAVHLIIQSSLEASEIHKILSMLWRSYSEVLWKEKL